MNAIDTSNYHIEGNKGNVKLVSSLTVDSALLIAPYFLCCTEPQIVWDRLIGFLHCAAWPHPSMRKQQITKSIKAPLFLGDKWVYFYSGPSWDQPRESHPHAPPNWRRVATTTLQCQNFCQLDLLSISARFNNWFPSALFPLSLRLSTTTLQLFYLHNAVLPKLARPMGKAIKDGSPCCLNLLKCQLHQFGKPKSHNHSKSSYQFPLSLCNQLPTSAGKLPDSNSPLVLC